MTVSNIKCILIDPAKKLLDLLYNIDKYPEENLYTNWIMYSLELYNNRSEFLILANTKKLGNNKWVNIIKNGFKKNYNIMKSKFLKSENSDIIDKNSIVINFNNNISDEYNFFYLIVFIFQYTCKFEEESINLNLWNYCLKSVTFSQKNFIVGLILDQNIGPQN